ncbi:MAG: PBECR2 nuclease fold domain-containing protein [Ruminococcus flavefaciens]|nr:PBECR2 nuclease fold domain-containing protein [Ruminococcus flavefaciens]
MLTEEQLAIISEALVPLFQYLETEVIVDVAERIAGSLSYSRTAELEAIAMRELGYSPARIRHEAMKILRANPEFRKHVAKNTLEHKKEVRRLLNEISREAYEGNNEILKRAADASWAADLAIWKEAGRELTDDSYLPQLVEAFTRQTRDELKNLTGTTGFRTVSGYEPIESLYQRELDKALIKVCSGTFSRDKVIADTVHDLAQSGLRSVSFASGHSMQLDTAVRLAVRTGCHQIAGRIMDRNMKNTGENLAYVSRHEGARNVGEGIANHEQWQGKVYYIREGKDYSAEAARIGQERIGDLWKETGYSADGAHENDPRGLYGYNCRHRYYVWFEGVSSLPAEELAVPKPVRINGRTYDYYAVTQKMRAMERAVRALKREKEALDRLGMDSRETDARIRHKVAEYKEFCKTCKVKEKTERMRYECGTSDLRRTKAWKEFNGSLPEDKKVITGAGINDIMETATGKEKIEVHTVGRINKDIYKCITEDITTDEVIITDERIAHIKERHPKDYKAVVERMEKALQSPDYILKDERINTGLIIKSMQQDNVQVVLRVHTSEDETGYKNSIISCWKISEKRLQNYLRNKEILYKKE